MEIEQFLREYKRIRSECTRKSYRGFLATFDLFLNDNNLTVDAVHPADIQRFAELIKGRFNPKTGTAGLSDVAVQSHLAAVSPRCSGPRVRQADYTDKVDCRVSASRFLSLFRPPTRFQVRLSKGLGQFLLLRR